MINPEAIYTMVAKLQAMVDILEKRIEVLETQAHKPFDFTDLVARLEKLEKGSK